VTRVPATPIHTVAAAAGRNRRQPIRMPPSKRITANANVTICWTASTLSLPSAGHRSEAIAAVTKKIAGAGIRTHSLSRWENTAANPTSAATSTARPNVSTAVIPDPSVSCAIPALADRSRLATSGTPRRGAAI
jgi:hypothetical protein